MGIAEPYPGLLRSFEFRQRPRVVCDSTPAFLEVPGKVLLRKVLLRQSNLVGKALVHITCRFRIPAQIRGRTQRREKHRQANHPLDGHKVVTTATRGSPALMSARDHRERAGLGAHGPPRGRRTPHEMLFGDAVSTTSIDLISSGSPA